MELGRNINRKRGVEPQSRTEISNKDPQRYQQNYQMRYPQMVEGASFQGWE